MAALSSALNENDVLKVRFIQSLGPPLYLLAVPMDVLPHLWGLFIFQLFNRIKILGKEAPTKGFAGPFNLTQFLTWFFFRVIGRYVSPPSWQPGPPDRAGP